MIKIATHDKITIYYISLQLLPGRQLLIFLRGKMEKLIYYPSFEVYDINWLKFALLYIKELKPIIPWSGEKHLSNFHKKLYNETDLIKPYIPKYDESEKATLIATEEIEKIFRNPEIYASIFRVNNVVERWKNRELFDFTLFNEKYTYDLERFCVRNGIGERCNEGVLIPNELGLIYMTILAQVIADENGISPITDRSGLDKYSIFIRQENRCTEDTITIAQDVLECKLPADLHKIPLDDIIKFRNRRGFKTKLNAFHSELEKYYKSKEDNQTAYDFENSLGSFWGDFFSDFIQTGIDLVSFSLKAWISVSSGSTVAANTVIDGATILARNTIRIKNTWNNTKSKRYCRKYLSNISRLNPHKYTKKMLKSR